jgi:hypothetical protein
MGQKEAEMLADFISTQKSKFCGTITARAGLKLINEYPLSGDFSPDDATEH